MTCDVNGMRRPCSDLAPQVVAFAYVALVGVVALVLAALYRFARLFGNYARGEIFTRASVRELRLVGYIAVANAVFQGVLFIAALALSREWRSQVAGEPTATTLRSARSS